MFRSREASPNEPERLQSMEGTDERANLVGDEALDDGDSNIDGAQQQPLRKRGLSALCLQEGGCLPHPHRVTPALPALSYPALEHAATASTTAPPNPHLSILEPIQNC